jgi:hypothetical protein
MACTAISRDHYEYKKNDQDICHNSAKYCKKPVQAHINTPGGEKSLLSVKPNSNKYD